MLGEHIKNNFFIFYFKNINITHEGFICELTSGIYSGFTCGYFHIVFSADLTVKLFAKILPTKVLARNVKPAGKTAANVFPAEI